MLRTHKLDDEYELYENLLFFWCIHPDLALDKLMLRKLRVSLTKVKDCEYYRSLGTDVRPDPYEIK